MIDIKEAKKEVNDMFSDLSPLVQEIVDKYSKDLDKHISKISTAITLTNDEIRSLMLEISNQNLYQWIKRNGGFKSDSIS